MTKSTASWDAPARTFRLSPEEVIFALCGYGIALLLIVFFGLRGRELEDAARIAGIIEGFAALILVFSVTASAFWFFTQQRNRPRLTVEQEARVIGRDETGYVVQVTACLKNEGELMVEIDSWNVSTHPDLVVVSTPSFKPETWGGSSLDKNLYNRPH